MGKMSVVVGAAVVVWTGFVALSEGSKDTTSVNSPDSPYNPS